MRRTATRPRTYRSHCHSTLIVPIRYARCRVAVKTALPLAPERATPYVHRRVAVYGALPRTLIAARQCTARSHVRSSPSGSVRRAPTYAHRRAAVYGVPSSEGHQRVLHMPPSALTACHLMPASLLRSSKSCPLSCMPSFLRPPCPIGVDITEKIDRLPGVLAGVNTHSASPQPRHHETPTLTLINRQGP